MKVKKAKNKPEKRKTRKQVRKEMRKAKKARKNEYYTRRNKPGRYVLLNPDAERQSDDEKCEMTVRDEDIKNNKGAVEESKADAQISKLCREKAKQAKLLKEMQLQRKKQLLEANAVEDRNIRKLEKQLKLHKRKSGVSIPKSFACDGLDYLLEVCDSEQMRGAVEAEKHLMDEDGGEFEEDFALIAGKSCSEKMEVGEGVESESQDDCGDSEEKAPKKLRKGANPDGEKEESDAESSNSGDDDEEENSSDSNMEDGGEEENEGKEIWEDIYGRLRDKDGTIIKETTESQKYVPPAARNDGSNSEDQNRQVKLNKLKRLLKGLLNRLAESNMHSISGQIEELYMSNSRNDMNNTLTDLIFQSLILPVKTPERLLLEHVVLIVILHANIGTEIGAHFLQQLVRKFDNLFSKSDDDSVEDKKLDNTVGIIAQLYNFKVFNSQLLYQILKKLAEKFEEKEVECVLLVLKSVGFTLRKDDPLALKDLILELQKRASGLSGNNDNARVKFMLDILLAIKNNNVTKIPNYDTSYAEHLKKLLKGFIRKGNYVTQLNISLEDLLKADERGKWWIVGSAWSGNLPETPDQNDKKEKKPDYSDKLLQLAKRQHMNTDTRKKIFCTMMSAEDYLDAFEKLLHLNLKNQQEREIVHVILHCCLKEKTFNPYYAHLAQKFCDHDRKFQMIIKYSVWDKLKALGDCPANQTSNLAKLLIHLFLEKGLSISTLKIMQFSELDRTTLRFVRQILLGILLHDDTEVVRGVFAGVARSEKLKMFRESMRLFLHHFLLRNLQGGGEGAGERRDLLEGRVILVERILAGKEGRTKL